MNKGREPNFLRDGLRNTGVTFLATVVALLAVRPSALLHQTAREWVTFLIVVPICGFTISGMSWVADRRIPQLVGDSAWRQRTVRLISWLFAAGLLVATFYTMSHH